MKFFLRKEITMKRLIASLLLISLLFSLCLVPASAEDAAESTLPEGATWSEEAVDYSTDNAYVSNTVNIETTSNRPFSQYFDKTIDNAFKEGATTMHYVDSRLTDNSINTPDGQRYDLTGNLAAADETHKYLGYLDIDLHKVQYIDNIKVYLDALDMSANYPGDGLLINGFDLLVSETGKDGSWKTVYSETGIRDEDKYELRDNLGNNLNGERAKQAWIDVNFDITPARYVRFALTESRDTTKYFRITQFEVFGHDFIPPVEEEVDEETEEPAINSLMLFPLLMRHRQYETETSTTMFGLRVKHLLRSADAITFEKNGIEAVISADALKALKLAGSDKLVVTITGTEPKDAKVDVTVNGKAVDIEVAIPGAPEVPQANVVTYRWDFNDLAEKNGSGNLTDSERSTKGYSLKDGIITVTDRTTDFVLAEGFKLTGANDWTIEWKADLERGSALFGATASANNFIYLAYETSGWKFPFRVVTGAGKAYMIPLGDYAKAMTEMNTWKAEYTAKNTTLTLKIYNESTKAWDVVGSVAMAGDYEFNITNLFGRYKSGTDVCLIGSVDYVQVSTVKEEEAATEIKDVHYRWDFNDLKGKDGKGNLTDSEKSTKGYTIENGLITVTDRTTDFVIDEGFELADTYDWSIEWKAQLSNASALFGTTASANNFVYLAYTVGSWKNPVRITTGEGTSYMIPLGDYMNKMTEMNTWKLGYSAKDKAMSLSFYDETAQSWEDVGSVAIPDPFTLKLTNLFGRYKAGTDVCLTGTVDYIDVVAKLTVEK